MRSVFNFVFHQSFSLLNIILPFSSYFKCFTYSWTIMHNIIIMRHLSWNWWWWRLPSFLCQGHFNIYCSFLSLQTVWWWLCISDIMMLILMMMMMLFYFSKQFHDYYTLFIMMTMMLFSWWWSSSCISHDDDDAYLIMMMMMHFS